jgi:preprotein translocase subunit SecD
MLIFSKLKITVICFFALLSVYLALPTFLQQNSNNTSKIWQFFVSGPKANLGLDLQGGAQILLEINDSNYLQEQLENILADLKTEFYQEQIAILPILSNNEIVFYNSNNFDNKKIKKIINKVAPNLDLKQENDAFKISFSSNEIAKIKKKLGEQSIEIVRKRIDENGTKEPVIAMQGQNRILLQVPGITDNQQIKQILGKTAKLTFHLLAENNHYDSFQISDGDGRIYNLQNTAIVTGDMLESATATYHEGKPAVAFSFNKIGTQKFADITKKNLGKIFAVVLDNKIVTAPVINTPITQGSGVISGSFSTEEASKVALLLRAGALPTPLNIIEERVIGPSLGLDSIKSGKISAVAGVVLVAIFMLLFYGIFGIFANIALVINLAIIIAVLAMLDGTLTLPGIAGIILTIGMSVDANVLIFERIKEELNHKKSVFIAVEQGFSQAYRTILDSNITTLIITFFLYNFGNGSIKGFSITLSIGIMSSMFTAVLFTRMLIALWLRKYKPHKLAIN